MTIRPSLSFQRLRESSRRQELAKLLTLLDDGDARGMKRLSVCAIDRLPYIIGVTGAAGVGKSLLLSKILALHKKARVGVLAVDPTSPSSGGALLGDRVRMPRLPAGVFLRSVATRGGTGGLSEKLVDMAAAMKAFGYDEVYIETVGIGQDELEIRQVADTVVVVESPGLGDEIQAMKISPLSVADIIVVNKSDKPGAAETAAVISETVNKKAILASALEGDGIADISDAIAREKKNAMKPAKKMTADRRKFEWRMARELTRRWSERISRGTGGVAGGKNRDRPAENIYKRIHSVLSFIPDHVAIAVPDLNEAVRVFQRLGFFLERRETVSSERVVTAFFNAGGFHVELLQPTSPDSPVSKFISERGGGIHHIAFEVEDLPEVARSIQKNGIQTLGGPRPGTRGKKILFLHPKSTCRALLELCSCADQPEKK